MMPKEPKLAEELKKMEYEELLPVEKKLIGYSLILGTVLLGVLIWISYTFFPGGHCGLCRSRKRALVEQSARAFSMAQISLLCFQDRLLALGPWMT
jgi:hypothetical protein